MNDFTLDDFKIGEVYGFIIGNDQGESDEIKGCVTGHNHMQLEDAQADLIIITKVQYIYCLMKLKAIIASIEIMKIILMPRYIIQIWMNTTLSEVQV